MKSRLLMFRILAVCVSLAAGLLIGCETGGSKIPNAGPDVTTDTTYRQGDKILIDFVDNPGIPQTWQQTVREDGTITLPLNQTVKAAGLRKGELEQAIHAAYVPKILTRLTVNIRADQRFYFVEGEVKNPGQKELYGAMTVMRAISAAGDFTDFADKSNIEVFRTNGEVVKVNGKEVLRDMSKDVPVYPGDRVRVDRRFL
jgi:protein involved in polysaccharide export with SLBB domain